MFEDTRIPTRLHAEPTHPYYDPWWSRNAVVWANGKQVKYAISANTESGYVTYYDDDFNVCEITGADVLIGVSEDGRRSLGDRPLPLSFYPNKEPSP